MKNPPDSAGWRGFCVIAAQIQSPAHRMLLNGAWDAPVWHRVRTGKRCQRAQAMRVERSESNDSIQTT
jgi:hypothetical protein